MKICLIAARTRNAVIGKSGLMPWHLPADLKWFKEKTKGHHILMGRITFVSLGKPLPMRTNMVLSRKKDFAAENVLTFHSPEDAIAFAENAGEDKLFVVGGAEIYRLMLPFADFLYLTEIATETEGDAFFPEFEQNEWKITEEIFYPKDEKNAFDLTFHILEKKAAL
jgi:dihydrofolate reductase